MTLPPSLHVLSNGHGEDEIACKIIDAVQALAPGRMRISAWAMVGAGEAYLRRGIPVGGPTNVLPGEGFGTLSPRAFLRDLAAGFIGTYGAQMRHARGLAGRHDLFLAVGDIVPLAAGWLAATPVAFMSCAKSAHYGGPDGHNALERALMRRACVEVFARDDLTAEGLARRGLRVCCPGNPMMDGLAPPDEGLLPGPGRAVALLPGSRRDGPENAALLLAVLDRLWQDLPEVAGIIACPPGLDPAAMARAACAAGPWRLAAPATADRAEMAHPSGGRALLIRGAFAAVLHRCQMAVGMAGTANEQAVGLGLPLVMLAGAGNQGAAYLRMKQRWFGPAALAVPRDAGAVAAALRAVLADPARQAAMAAAGRARMGGPGASAAIAARLLDHLTWRAAP